MRFVGEPRCHMTAIGKAFILRDFFRHILTKQRIGKFRQEIENEMVTLLKEFLTLVDSSTSADRTRNCFRRMSGGLHRFP